MIKSKIGRSTDGCSFNASSYSDQQKRREKLVSKGLHICSLPIVAVVINEVSAEGAFDHLVATWQLPREMV